MTNVPTGPTPPTLSSLNSTPNFSLYPTHGKHAPSLSATRLALPATSSAKSSQRRSKSGASSLVVRRLARPKKRRRIRPRLRRRRRSARRPRRLPALVLRRVRRVKMDRRARRRKRKLPGEWSRSACRLRSLDFCGRGLRGSGVEGSRAGGRVFRVQHQKRSVALVCWCVSANGLRVRPRLQIAMRMVRVSVPRLAESELLEDLS